MYSIQSLLNETPQFKGSFVDGKWKAISRPSGSWECISPANIDWALPPVSYSFDFATEAVSAGTKAFKKWSKIGMHQRIDYLRSFAEQIKKRSDRLAKYLSLETGKPLAESTAEVDLWLQKLRLR